MEAILVPILIIFFILVIALGADKASKVILPLTIIGVLIYFFGWLFIKYFWIIIPVYFITKVLRKSNSSSNNTYRGNRTQGDDFFNTYRNSSNRTGQNGTRYSGTFNSREEAEEFFRTFFGGNANNTNNAQNGTRYSGTFNSREEAEEFFRTFFGGNANNTNNAQNGTRYSGTFNSREEAEEFFRTFFGDGFGGNYGGQGSTYSGNTYGNSSGGYRQGGGYQRTGTYTSNRSRYYRILGLKDGASQEEIKKAYRQLAKEHHPDKFANASDSEKKYHESKMKEINEAYENLKI